MVATLPVPGRRRSRKRHFGASQRGVGPSGKMQHFAKEKQPFVDVSLSINHAFSIAILNYITESDAGHYL